MQYHFVEKKKLKPYRFECSKIFNEIRESLNQKHGIKFQNTLIGSGAKNFVTQYGEDPFDLDYNLEIMKNNKNYTEKEIKDVIRTTIDNIVIKYGFKPGEDSTSAITYKKKDLSFSFDVGIIIKNKYGELQRLIHNKNTNNFIWCLLPNSKELYKKRNEIKQVNKTNELKEIYLQKKNQYLSESNNNHSSFNIYIESVNELYDKINNKFQEDNWINSLKTINKKKF